MQGCKQFEPRLFYQISLNDLVPQNHLGYLQDKGIETVIRQRKGGNSHGGFDKSEFSYDSELDIYRCPSDQILRRRHTQSRNGKAMYSCDVGVCGACKLRGQCIASSDSDAVRQVKRYDTGYVERAQAACASGQGRSLLKKRQTCIEGLFGQAKSQHGLDRARLRGLAKMHIQGLLTAMVLNVKKLLQAVLRSSVLAKSVVLEVAGNSFEYLLFRLFGLCYPDLCFETREKQSFDIIWNGKAQLWQQAPSRAQVYDPFGVAQDVVCGLTRI